MPVLSEPPQVSPHAPARIPQNAAAKDVEDGLAYAPFCSAQPSRVVRGLPHESSKPSYCFAHVPHAARELRLNMVIQLLQDCLEIRVSSLELVVIIDHSLSPAAAQDELERPESLEDQRRQLTRKRDDGKGFPHVPMLEDGVRGRFKKETPVQGRGLRAVCSPTIRDRSW